MPTEEGVVAEGKDIENRPSTATVSLPLPPLALGWTRLKRQRDGQLIAKEDQEEVKKQKNKKNSGELASIPLSEQGNKSDQQHQEKDNDDDSDDDDDDWLTGLQECCNDPSCVRRVTRTTARQPTPTTDLIRTSTNKKEDDQDHEANIFGSVVRGQVVWFLPEMDCTWFQGYLFFDSPSNDIGVGATWKKKPWGLLAREVEIDECLACAAGGYRRLELTVYPHSSLGSSSLTRSSSKGRGIKLGAADWTGGDMMKLRGAQVKMKPRQFLTGRKAVPYVQGVFASLWKRIRVEQQQEAQIQQQQVETSSGTTTSEKLLGVLDVLPDVAVILGTLELVIKPQNT